MFTASDARYRFRIEIAPLHLPYLTFIAILVIGAASLGIDLWYAERWPTLVGLVGQAGLQACLGLGFLSLLIVWIVVAFVRPPIFGRKTAKHFYAALYRRILKGEAADMAMAADELARSMDAIVKHCPETRHRRGPAGAIGGFGSSSVCQ